MPIYQAIDQNGNPISNVMCPTTTETQTLAGSSVQFAVNNTDAIQAYRLYSAVNIHYLIGTNPVATTSTVPLPATTAEQILIFPGERLAAIGTGAVSLTLYRGATA